MLLFIESIAFNETAQRLIMSVGLIALIFIAWLFIRVTPKNVLGRIEHRVKMEIDAPAYDLAGLSVIRVGKAVVICRDQDRVRVLRIWLPPCPKHEEPVLKATWYEGDIESPQALFEVSGKGITHLMNEARVCLGRYRVRESELAHEAL